MHWPESSDAAPLGDGFGATAVEHPGTIDELRSAVVRRASEGLAIYPQGGKTALDYGGLPRRPGVAIDTTGLKAVIDYPAADMTITVEAGITLGELQTILATEGQRLTLDAPFPDQATMGGIYATNTCGPRRFGAGRPRDLILGVSFITADGKEVKGGGRVVKNVAGYDFPKLLTGSMGTLGIITQMTLKVRPKPEASALVVFPIAEPSRLDHVLAGMNTSGTRPIALEVLNQSGAEWFLENDDLPEGWTLVVGFEDNAASVSWQVDRILQEVSTNREEARVFEGEAAHPYWQRLADFEAIPYNRLLTFSASLPISSAFPLARVLDPENWRIRIHAGSGIVHGHASADFPPEVLFGEVAKLRAEAPKLGGSLILSRCPADWKTRLNVWGDRRGDWAIMERIKKALDPDGVMNPGRFAGTI